MAKIDSLLSAAIGTLIESSTGVPILANENPVLRMPRADERLRANHLAHFQINRRLIPKLEPPLREHFPQVHSDGGAGIAAYAQRGDHLPD